MTHRSHESQGPDMTNSAPLPSASRRQLLQVGGLGALGAAFLAACGTDAYDTRPGVAGAGAPVTSVPPTVPQSGPNSAQIAAQETELHTLVSVEALLAETYRAHGSTLSDEGLRGAAERFAADHEDAAERIASETDSGEVDAANEDLRARMVEPVERTLEPLTSSDTEEARVEANTAVLALFRGLETSLAATYINSMSTITTAEMRGEFAAIGAAAARRAAVLTSDVLEGAPTSALFPVTDLIPGSAYHGASDDPAAEDQDLEGEGVEGEDGGGTDPAEAEGGRSGESEGDQSGD